MSSAATIQPMAAPNRAATPSARAKAASGGTPQRSIATARNTLVKPITEPIERSMPPETITKVMPTATMPRKALSVRRLPTTRVDRKAGNCAAQSA